MKSIIGVYEDHDAALNAVKELKDGGYPVKQLSIIGKAEVSKVDEEMHVHHGKSGANVAGLSIGTTIGATIGILTGVGLFAIPGLGFLYGAGALVGAIAGFDFGILGGGIASLLTVVGVEEAETKKYQADLEEGKYLLVAQGDDTEVNKAVAILEAHGKHHHLGAH